MRPPPPVSSNRRSNRAQFLDGRLSVSATPQPAHQRSDDRIQQNELQHNEDDGRRIQKRASVQRDAAIQQPSDEQHDQTGSREDLVEKPRTPKGKRQMGGAPHSEAEPKARAGTAADRYDRDEDERRPGSGLRAPKPLFTSSLLLTPRLAPEREAGARARTNRRASPH